MLVGLEPDVVEVPWPKQAVTGFGIGPRKFTEHYVYLALHQGHVNLVNEGAELDDPAGLLAGGRAKPRAGRGARPRPPAAAVGTMHLSGGVSKLARPRWDRHAATAALDLHVASMFSVVRAGSAG